jgi:triosephosphate isomerase (TIM)
MRKQIAAANWKMNLTLEQANSLVNDLLQYSTELAENQEAIFAVPFPYLIPVTQWISGKQRYSVAAQNCYMQKSGAFTGEVSAEMLASIGIPYTIIGHSERREYFNENNQVLAAKLDLCFEYNLKPIFCCGEPLSIRESNDQFTYVTSQLKESLFHLPAEKMMNFVIAYEPIWAIGTGKTASSEQAQEMHQTIREVLSEQYGSEVADSISILYGGSVKANNAKELFSQPDVDGGLVGGASLSAAEFDTIIKSLKA